MCSTYEGAFEIPIWSDAAVSQNPDLISKWRAAREVPPLRAPLQRTTSENHACGEERQFLLPLLAGEADVAQSDRSFPKSTVCSHVSVRVLRQKRKKSKKKRKRKSVVSHCDTCC